MRRVKWQCQQRKWRNCEPFLLPTMQKKVFGEKHVTSPTIIPWVETETDTDTDRQRQRRGRETETERDWVPHNMYFQ